MRLMWSAKRPTWPWPGMCGLGVVSVVCVLQSSSSSTRRISGTLGGGAHWSGCQATMPPHCWCCRATSTTSSVCVLSTMWAKGRPAEPQSDTKPRPQVCQSDHTSSNTYFPPACISVMVNDFLSIPLLVFLSVSHILSLSISCPLYLFLTPSPFLSISPFSHFSH